MQHQNPTDAQQASSHHEKMEQSKCRCVSAVLNHKFSEAPVKLPSMAGSLTSVSSVAQDRERTLEEAAIPTAGQVGADNPQGSAL